MFSCRELLLQFWVSNPCLNTWTWTLSVPYLWTFRAFRVSMDRHLDADTAGTNIKAKGLSTARQDSRRQYVQQTPESSDGAVLQH